MTNGPKCLDAASAYHRTRGGRQLPEQIARAMIPTLGLVSVTLAWLVMPSVGLAQSSPACAGPPPPPSKSQALSAALKSSGRVGVKLACGVPPPPAQTERQRVGAPFLTQAHALARGDYALACAQLSAAVLRRVKARSLRAARRACVRQLRSEAKGLDGGRLGSLASTRVVKVRVTQRRARVTVQTTLYGVKPRATGTTVREGGRWKIAKPLSGAHVGRSLVERIPSESMVPTLRAGDTILVDQDAYRKATPAIGDIVVFHPPAGAETNECAKRPPKGQACASADRHKSKQLFVKRIVAGPGDRMSISDGHVIRNGALAPEAFIQPCDGQAEGCDFPATFTVTAGRYYMLGDNRGASDDSRFWGPVAAGSIIGRVRRLGP